MPLFELSFIYRDFSGAAAKKAFIFKHFRRIESRPKLPSKITKLTLTHKTRNRFACDEQARGFESHHLRHISTMVLIRNHRVFFYIG